MGDENKVFEYILVFFTTILLKQHLAKKADMFVKEISCIVDSSLCKSRSTGLSGEHHWGQLFLTKDF